MKEYYQFKELILMEGIKSDLKDKHPDYSDEIDFLAPEDPSGRNKYLKWAVQQLIASDMPVEEIAGVIKSFHDKNQRLDNRDMLADTIFFGIDHWLYADTKPRVKWARPSDSKPHPVRVRIAEDQIKKIGRIYKDISEYNMENFK